MSEPTPPPWVQKGDPETGTLCVTDHDSRYVVDRFRPCGRPEGEVVANARLIAAAPDLLAALKGVIRVADRRTVEFDAAHAAVAKAEGRS